MDELQPVKARQRRRLRIRLRRDLSGHRVHIDRLWRGRVSRKDENRGCARAQPRFFTLGVLLPYGRVRISDVTWSAERLVAPENVAGFDVGFDLHRVYSL